MIKSINNIALRHLNGIYIQKVELDKIDPNMTPDDEFLNGNKNTLSIAEFATIVKKFQGFGYTFEKDLASIIFRLDRKYAIDVCEEMLENIKDFKSDKNYTVFYENFPDEVINMETADIYLNQVLHYWFGYLPNGENGDTGKEDYGTEPSELVKLSHLKFVSDDEIEKLFENLLLSNVTLSQQYLDDVCFLSDGFSVEELEKYSENIKMKETLTTFSSYNLKKRNVLIGNFDTATDILRLITKISNYTFNKNNNLYSDSNKIFVNSSQNFTIDNSLNTKHIHFKYFNRTELNAIMQKLDEIPNILPDIKRYRKVWHNFFLFYAKKINLKKYKNVKKAADMLFGEFSFETEKGYFNKMKSNIQKMNDDELKTFINRFSKYSGDYARNVLSLLNVANENQYEIIITGLKNCMKDVNNRVLLQLYDRILNLMEKENLKNIKASEKTENTKNIENIKYNFDSIEKNNNFEKIRKVFRRLVYKDANSDKNEISNNNGHLNKNGNIDKKNSEIIPRIVNSRGFWRKLDETIFLNENLLKFLLETVKNGILENLKLKEPLKNVFIDESYKNIMVSTSEKDSNISLKPMTRGSKISFNENAEVLRFFVGWKNIKNGKTENRVDIDLSVICFDKNFKFLKTVAYYNQVEKNFVFSGDITDAPNGALEFIDVYDLKNLKNDNIRYVLMEIRSYNGRTFEEIGSVYAGVLELTKKESESEKNLYSAAVTQGFQILSKNQTTNTILIDFEKNEYVWIDMNMPVVIGYQDNNYLNESDIASLQDVLKYFVNKKYVTMYDLLQFNATARGTQVFEKENADIIFEKVDNDNPLPLNDILANFF